MGSRRGKVYPKKKKAGELASDARKRRKRSLLRGGEFVSVSGVGCRVSGSRGSRGKGQVRFTAQKMEQISARQQVYQRKAKGAHGRRRVAAAPEDGHSA